MTRIVNAEAVAPISKRARTRLFCRIILSVIWTKLLLGLVAVAVAYVSVLKRARYNRVFGGGSRAGDAGDRGYRLAQLHYSQLAECCRVWPSPFCMRRRKSQI